MLSGIFSGISEKSSCFMNFFDSFYPGFILIFFDCPLNYYYIIITEDMAHLSSSHGIPLELFASV